MPHATVMPTAGKGVVIRQHLPFSQASFSLAHNRAQPTNGDYTFQFELIGTCDKTGPGLYWPGADDAVLLDLYRKVIQPLSDAFIIPLRTPKWLAYPASYGTDNGVRLSDSTFDTWSGWLGHQHVPQNVHGDPGAFPWARMMTLAKPKDVIRGPLQLGDSGASVTIAQKHLGVVMDGNFGPQTQAAVVALQNKAGLAADGIIGPRTAAAMGCDYIAA